MQRYLSTLLLRQWSIRSAGVAYTTTTLTTTSMAKTMTPTIHARQQGLQGQQQQQQQEGGLLAPYSASSSSSSSSHLSWGLRLAAPAAALSLANERQERPAETCGIVGVVGGEDARGILLEGLTVLQNRGYDSAGIATISPDQNALIVTKYASAGSTHDCIDLVKENSHRHKRHQLGIAHTRWATHGGKTDLNAHPHMDINGRVAVVHNGTITNSHELRAELQKTNGIKFASETDTEIIAQLIGLGLDQELSLKEAVEEALKRCDGTWGLVVLSPKEPEELIVACNGSTMVLGIGEERVFIASETSAFNRHTKNFIALKDGEIGVVRADASTLDLSRVQKAPEVNILLSPDPYPHWTIRECLEQPEAIARALAFGGRMSDTRVFLGGLDRQKERMKNIEHLIITGCGTSLHAAMYAAKLMRGFDAFRTVLAVDAAEVRQSDLPKHHAGLLAI
jgi:glucosamine--fructose-6-phosphate aminotransferase (isomerizing)